MTFLPVLFLTAVLTRDLLFAPEGFSALTNALWQQPIPYVVAVGIGVLVSAAFLGIFALWLKGVESRGTVAVED